MSSALLADAGFLLAYLVLPVFIVIRMRSLTWAVVSITGVISIAGAAIGFGIDNGHRWNLIELQWTLLICLLVVALIALFWKRPTTVPFRRQFVSILVPVIAVSGFLLISRMAARPFAGGLTAVGYFVDHASGEDNAKWLDFSGQLMSGAHINQGVFLGGALQLVIVFVATVLSVVSGVLLGGVNEVFVAANSVVYSQFLLIALVPLALSPLAEARFQARNPDRERSERSWIPAPALWAGALVLVTACAALLNFGHFTLQWVILVVTLWIAVFLASSDSRNVRIIAALIVATSVSVWFPMAPIAVVILAAIPVWLITMAVRHRAVRRADVLPWVAWLIVCLLMAQSLRATLLYMTDQAAPMAADAGGAVRGVAAAFHVPALDLLTSQGGTESTGPILAILLAASFALAALFISAWRVADSRGSVVVGFLPALIVLGYGLLLSVLGTWWAGSGPAYGAVKVTFMASITVLAVVLPVGIMQFDRLHWSMNTVKWISLALVVYLLAADGILPRAMTLVSPQRWPKLATYESNYWWPAEVRAVANQSIASNPIGCAYYSLGSNGPTALPNGQMAYDCTRILTGLSGADATAQPLVEWARREWLTNTAAWSAAWPDLVTMPDSVLDKQMILLDDSNHVIGMETVRSLLDRYRPQWALGQDLATAKP